jgi:hypothetical protein
MGKVLQLQVARKCPNCDCGRFQNHVVFLRDYKEGETFKICGECREIVLEQNAMEKSTNGRVPKKEW